MMPSHLGPKSPRVTNANHEIRQYAQVLKWWLALLFKFSLNPQMDFAIWITHSLREGLGELAKLKNVLEDRQPPNVEAWGIYSPLEKLAIL